MKIKHKNEHIVKFSEKEWEDLARIFDWASNFLIEKRRGSDWPDSLRKLSEELE